VISRLIASFRLPPLTPRPVPASPEGPFGLLFAVRHAPRPGLGAARHRLCHMWHSRDARKAKPGLRAVLSPLLRLWTLALPKALFASPVMVTVPVAPTSGSHTQQISLPTAFVATLVLFQYTPGKIGERGRVAHVFSLICCPRLIWPMLTSPTATSALPISCPSPFRQVALLNLLRTHQGTLLASFVGEEGVKVRAALLAELAARPDVNPDPKLEWYGVNIRTVDAGAMEAITNTKLGSAAGQKSGDGRARLVAQADGVRNGDLCGGRREMHEATLLSSFVSRPAPPATVHAKRTSWSACTLPSPSHLLPHREWLRTLAA